ncbi:MAG: EAL domain-containing protein [Acidobacteriota bacterium]
MAKPVGQTTPRAAAESDEISEEEIAEVHRIADAKELGIAFQPIFELRSGEIYAYEALSRIRSKVFTNLERFYRAAAVSGRVGTLGRLHREQAIRLAPRLPLFLNVNPNEFNFPWLVRADDPIFRREDVYLELTESVPLSHFEQCRSVMEEVRKKGVHLAVDDLGAGYSNLKYISDLVPEIVKLDRDLITGIRNGTRQFRLLDSIVRLCKNLNAKVVAEGIETPEELASVQHANIDFCQGYLLGMPMQAKTDHLRIPDESLH